MIKIHVRLFGILRDSLPPEAKGRTTLTLPDEAVVRDVLNHFKVPQVVTFAVNEEVDLDDTFSLKDGDKVEIFRISAGG